jgi:hypothetical protein
MIDPIGGRAAKFLGRQNAVGCIHTLSHHGCLECRVQQRLRNRHVVQARLTGVHRRDGLGLQLGCVIAGRQIVVDGHLIQIVENQLLHGAKQSLISPRLATT